LGENYQTVINFLFFGYSGAKNEPWGRCLYCFRQRKICSSGLPLVTWNFFCTAFANTCKAPPQTAETPAFTETKTPLHPKVRSKDATTDHLENPRKLPALRAEVIGQSVG
jgi:hypothetical protein